jgi:hypothetical protein
MKFKKADLELEKIATILLILVGLIIMILIIYILRDKIIGYFDKILNILRFG